MRVAFTHNVQTGKGEEEAEFDTPATVARIAEALGAAGHDVVPIDAALPVDDLIARLRAARPDLVFNTAEGTRGRFREAFLPALFDRLGVAFTGSDAFACALTMDKRLTKLAVAQHGVPVAADVLVRRAADIEAAAALPFPLLVKPNAEGSSMGIRADAVVEDARALRERAASLLREFPDGVLVEEYVAGRDIVVPFLEGAAPASGGVLEPAGYAIDARRIAPRRHPIYDLELKTVADDAVAVVVPAPLSAATRTKLVEASRTVFDVLEIRDLGRIDFRVRDDGSFCFLEINALPSLQEGAAIYLSAALAGLPTMEAVLGHVVANAALRRGR